MWPNLQVLKCLALSFSAYFFTSRCLKHDQSSHSVPYSSLHVLYIRRLYQPPNYDALEGFLFAFLTVGRS